MDARPDMPESPPRDGTPPPSENDDVRTILSDLGHELCRPLTSLRMGFDLLLADAARPITHDQLGHVRTMVGLCDDLLRMTHTYLDYAGLVQGTHPLLFGTFTIGALVNDTGRTFAPAAASRRIAWSCGLDGPDATVTTDATRCQQVFANLAANALKFTPEGGEVRVEARLDGGHWSVTVSDNGPGIPAEHHDHVFQPFYRLTREEHARVGGDGLGLAVCRELVHQLGGEITLDSGAGYGTRVTVEFPVDASEAVSARKAGR